jgi:methionyl-tRNA synthetase
MIAVNFNNKVIEDYIKKDCNNNIPNFIEQVAEFINQSKTKNIEDSDISNLVNLQEKSMKDTWDNKDDDAWGNYV